MRPGWRMWIPHGSGWMQSTCTAGMHQRICYVSLLPHCICQRAYSLSLASATTSFITRPGLSSLLPRSPCSLGAPSPNLSQNNNISFWVELCFYSYFHFWKNIMLITCIRTTWRPSSISKTVHLFWLNSIFNSILFETQTSFFIVRVSLKRILRWWVYQLAVHRK